MRDLILYSTLGCHLCEQARALCEPILSGHQIELTEADIAEDEVLLEAYGVRIPVLRDPARNTELGWPFGAAELIAWLEEAG